MTQYASFLPKEFLRDALGSGDDAHRCDRHVGADAPADKIREYMATLHGYQGIPGPYDFRDGTNRGLNDKGVVVTRWDAATTGWVPVSRPGGMPR